MPNDLAYINVSEINKRISERNEKHEIFDLPENFIITNEYKRVRKYLENGYPPLIMISGKAGTGKSTFIKYFRSKTNKKVIVVAPTGVAALNVKGQTIHSFFQFAPRIVEPKSIKKIFFNRTLYEKLEVIIIDEASMVRADLLDGIDKFMRINTNNHEKPFGGVQIVLVGDFFQLPPVTKSEESEVLREKGYETPYFFSAHCIKDCQLAYIELSRYFRQKDDNFISILNNIRENKNTDVTIEMLNTQCFKATENPYKLSSIILTCKNKHASYINDNTLNRIKNNSYTYEGKVTGKFNISEHNIPSPYKLTLKVGAKVMFTKNDYQHRWINGTLGRVIYLDEKKIKVETNKGNFYVPQVTWENVKYTYNKEIDKIESKVVGTYTQYPLLLAWAITIHKSQGKTLKNVCIDLGQGAFEYGQTYVALSRCPNIQDIKLKRPLKSSDIKVDPKIVELYEYLRNNSREQQQNG